MVERKRAWRFRRLKKSRYSQRSCGPAPQPTDASLDLPWDSGRITEELVTLLSAPVTAGEETTYLIELLWDEKKTGMQSAGSEEVLNKSKLLLLHSTRGVGNYRFLAPPYKKIRFDGEKAQGSVFWICSIGNRVWSPGSHDLTQKWLQAFSGCQQDS